MPEKTKPRHAGQGFEGVNNSEVIHVENHSTNVIPFKFDQREVRTLLIKNQPWFVAADVCRILGQSNTTKALQALDDDERSNFKLGRQGITNIINESGLYTLILRCDDAIRKGSDAYLFRKWVAGEVLPAIRKHGRYEDEQGRMPTLVNELIGISELNVIKGTMRDKAKDVAPAKRRSFHAAMCSRLHTRFNVPRLELIPADQFEAACNFVAAYALEGEWIEARRQEGVISFNDDEAQYLHLLISHSKQLVKMVDEIYRAGGALGSDLLIGAASHLWEIRSFISRLDRQKSGELARLHEQRMAPARRAAA